MFVAEYKIINSHNETQILQTENSEHKQPQKLTELVPREDIRADKRIVEIPRKHPLVEILLGPDQQL